MLPGSSDVTYVALNLRSFYDDDDDDVVVSLVLLKFVRFALLRLSVVTLMPSSFRSIGSIPLALLCSPVSVQRLSCCCHDVD